MKKIKEFLLRTSSQFAISSILIMVLIFSAVAFNVYQKLSDYITEQSASAIDTLITQTQERLNSTLRELDSNMQQFCNAMLVQEALYSNSYKNQITSTQLAAVRRQIMQTVAYNDAIDNIELFSAREMIYPFTRASIDQTLLSSEIALADQQNGEKSYGSPILTTLPIPSAPSRESFFLITIFPLVAIWFSHLKMTFWIFLRKTSKI